MLRTPRVAAVRPSMALGTLSSFVAVAAAVAIARSGSLSTPPVLAVLALAGAVILLSFRPEALLVSWLALAPFLQEFGSHFAIGHPLGLALYRAPPLVFLFWTLSAPTRMRPFGVARRLGFVDALPAAYFLFVLGSMSVTGQVSATSLRHVYLSAGIGVILYYFVAFGPLRSLAPSRLVGVLIALALLEALMSIIDGLTGWNLWHDTSWQRGNTARAVATLGDPASLGTFIGMGIVLALCVLVWNGPPHLRRLAVGTVAVGLPGLFFTYTRGPIVATIIVASLVLLSRLRTRLLAVCVLALMIVVITASWSRLTSSALYQDRVTRANTVEIRVELQRWSLKLAEERPLFGWGYDSFDRVLRAADFGSGNLPRSEVVSSTSHNTFLTILVEYGSIGLALFVLPWLVIGRRALAGALRFPDGRWLLLGCVAALVLYVFGASGIDFRFYSFVPAVPWLLLGLLRRHLSSVHEV
jgi:O-antigen ligase